MSEWKSEMSSKFMVYYIYGKNISSYHVFCLVLSRQLMTTCCHSVTSSLVPALSVGTWRCCNQALFPPEIVFEFPSEFSSLAPNLRKANLLEYCSKKVIIRAHLQAACCRHMPRNSRTLAVCEWVNDPAVQPSGPRPGSLSHKNSLDCQHNQDEDQLLWFVLGKRCRIHKINKQTFKDSPQMIALITFLFLFLGIQITIFG